MFTSCPSGHAHWIHMFYTELPRDTAMQENKMGGKCFCVPSQVFVCFKKLLSSLRKNTNICVPSHVFPPSCPCRGSVVLVWPKQKGWRLLTVKTVRSSVMIYLASFLCFGVWSCILCLIGHNFRFPQGRGVCPASYMSFRREIVTLENIYDI